MEPAQVTMTGQEAGDANPGTWDMAGDANPGTWDMANMRILTKAMELPLVPTLTGTLAATTQLISGLSVVTRVHDTMKEVAEIEGVKSAINTVSSTYESSLAPSVEILKQRVAPTVQSLDGLACDSVDRINTKVSETREVYVTPVVNKVTTVTESTTKVYSDAVNYGKELLTSTKENTIGRANDTVAYCREYVANTKTAVIQQLVEYKEETVAYARDQTKKSLDRAKTYAQQQREFVVTRAQSLLVNVKGATLTTLETYFPTTTAIVIRSYDIVTTTTQRVVNTTITTTTWTLDTSKDLYGKARTGYDWSRETLGSARQTLYTTSSLVVTSAEEFANNNAESIEYLVNWMGVKKYIDFLGLELKKQKTM